ncbi:hypothetical protein APSETT444_002261 [Aspergillus pseudonomiae]
MIGVQMVMLKVALDNRPAPGVKNSLEHVPFSSVSNGGGLTRPYDFWQWKSAKPQEVIPWAFRLCALFQCVCDLYLGVQFWMYSKASFGAAGSPREPSGNWTVEEKDIRMT